MKNFQDRQPLRSGQPVRARALHSRNASDLRQRRTGMMMAFSVLKKVPSRDIETNWYIQSFSFLPHINIQGAHFDHRLDGVDPDLDIPLAWLPKSNAALISQPL